jgi:hypothetical protein
MNPDDVADLVLDEDKLDRHDVLTIAKLTGGLFINGLKGGQECELYHVGPDNCVIQYADFKVSVGFGDHHYRDSTTVEVALLDDQENSVKITANEPDDVKGWVGVKELYEICKRASDPEATVREIRYLEDF